jgi:hypothetical protein
MFNFADARPLTEREQRGLVQMMYMAFVEIRAVARQPEKCEPARHLADVFHNLPLQFYSEKFSLPRFMQGLEHNQEKYKSSLTFDHLAEWKKLNAANP